MAKNVGSIFLLTGLLLLSFIEAVSQPIAFPVACYNFDGSLINDDPSAGIADLGALNNLGTYESGSGICYGTDSVYVFGQGDGLSLSKNNLPQQTYSLELYFQFTSASASASGRRRILRFKSENDAGLYLSADGRLVFQSDNNQSVLDSGTTVINEGDWMNISITRDGTVTPPEIIIYLNGKEEIRVPTDNSTELLNDFKIFEDNSGGDPLYKNENASGKIDYLRFYDKALDATQIDDLFSAGQIKSDMLITAAPDSTICFGETITLTASGGDGTYSWSTGETTTSIIVSPLDTTVYWVESTIQTPCDRKCFKSRDSLTVNVVQFPTTAILVSTPTCINSPVTLSYVGSSALLTSTFDWNFAGGSAVNTSGETYDVTWNSSGTKNITLRVTENGCFSDTLISIQIYEPPTSSFAFPASVCALQPAPISYTGTGTAAATYTWNFDGGTATQIGSSQNYTVVWADLVTTTKVISLTVTENGCSSTTFNSVSIIPAPTSTFTLPTGACVQDNLQLTYTGTANPLTATFNWNFDGASATQTPGTQNYTLSWPTGGIKTITLTITENGCVSTQTVATLNVNNLSSFTITSNQSAICDTGTILVSFTGSYEPLAILNWNFDGGTATQIPGTDNYTVTWPTIGIKTVSLNIIGDQCPNASASETITIYATPTSDFSLSSNIVCLLDPITISYTGTASASATYDWNFGGGQYAQTSGESYVVFWETGGSKTISLTVTENGCPSSTTFQTITVNNDSNFDVSVVDQSCITNPVTVTFVGSSEIGSTLVWDFDGGTPTSIGTEVYEVVWPTSGVKNISLTIQGVACPNASTVKTITIGAIPVLDFSSPVQVCANQSATVMYNGTNTIGKFLTWDFGDAAIVDSVAYEQYNVTWATTGTKSINVSINDYGCVQNTTLQVEVLDAPTALFTIDDFVCTNTLTPVSYSGTGTASASFTWNFDGGTATATSGLENYEVSWSTLGTKYITLSVSENNCTSLVYSDSISVVAPETFIITANNDIVCEGDNNLIIFGGVAETGALYIWNFDDGVATKINGEEVYDVNWSIPGIKNVTLVVIGSYCSSDTITKIVTVLPKPDPTFSADPAVCINLAATINYTGVPDPSWVFTWDFDGGVPTAIGNEDYMVIWNTGGIKIVTLSINNSGCITEMYSDTIKVNNYAQFDITPDQNVICAGETVNFKFIGSRENGATLTWDFDGGLSTMVTDEEYNVIWPTTGQKNIVITVNGISCPNSDTTRVIYIKNKPTPTFSSPKAICLAESANIAFTGQADAGSTFNWTFDNGVDTQVTGNEEYNVNWPDVGLKVITLLINNNNGDTTSNGCLSDLATDTVSVLNFSKFNSTLDSICADEILTVDFSNNDTLSSPLSYVWDFDGANFVNGTGLGPYQMSWSNSNFGNKVVRLDVQGLVCSSDSLVHNVTVEENLVPSLVITADSIYCSATDIQIVPASINEGPNPEYRWFVNNQYVYTGATFALPELVNGDEVFAILSSSIKCLTFPNAVSNSVTINISDFTFPGNLTGEPNPICPGDSSSFLIDSSYAGIQWQESAEDIIWNDILGEVSNLLVVSPDIETYYRVIVTDSVCVDISPSTLIEISDITNIEAGEDRTLREGYSIQLQASNGSDFIWSPATGLSDSTIFNPVASPVESIIYNVTGTTLEGCPDIDSLVITVTSKLGIPNTFTPNGDGVNDTWIIDSVNEYPDAQVHIYNRWGKEIFKSIGYDLPWDGRFNSQNLAESTYYYVIDLKDGFPQLRGSITIIK